jgi:hypothetical protein
VLLVSGGSVEALNRNLAGLCNPSALDLPEQTLTEEAAQRQAALHWLQTNPGWLLILDNVDTPEAAAEVVTLLPQLSGGQLVISTRVRNWSAAVQLQEVEVLTPEDATAFLLERTAGRRREAADDTSEARAIAVEDLGGLALALEQAGAYICQRRLSLSAYRSQWQSNRQVVLAWNEPRLTQYDRNLATTWLTSYQQVSEAARTLLRRLAWICLALAIRASQGSMIVGRTTLRMSASLVKCWPRACLVRSSLLASKMFPKVLGHTSRQSSLAHSTSWASWEELRSIWGILGNSPPLKYGVPLKRPPGVSPGVFMAENSPPSTS